MNGRTGDVARTPAHVQWMMTAAARREKLLIRLIADAPRKIRSNLGRGAVHGCVWVMYQERTAPSNDASFLSLFLNEPDQPVGTPSKSVQHMRWKSNNLQAR